MPPKKIQYKRNVIPVEGEFLDRQLKAFRNRPASAQQGEATGASPEGGVGVPGTSTNEPTGALPPVPDPLVEDPFTGHMVPKSTLTPVDPSEPTGDAPEEEETGGRKPRKLPPNLEGWETYVPILAKLKLISDGHERENILRYLMLYPPQGDGRNGPFAGRVYWDWCCESSGVGDDDKRILLRMPQQMASGFYFNLTHRNDGLSIFDPKSGIRYC